MTVRFSESCFSGMISSENHSALFRIMLPGHDLLRKPLRTFRDHAVPPPLQPSHPQLAVSAAIFRGGNVLLVRRARSPAKGFYSLPGGRVEFGEKLHAALCREVAEETGLTIDIIGLAGWREVMPAMTGSGHYLIMSFAARWTAGEVMLNDELDEFRWLAPESLEELKITGGLQDVIQSARRLLGT
jgi:8-oxo-dGTP diphosphatase